MQCLRDTCTTGRLKVIKRKLSVECPVSRNLLSFLHRRHDKIHSVAAYAFYVLMRKFIIDWTSEIYLQQCALGWIVVSHVQTINVIIIAIPLFKNLYYISTNIISKTLMNNWLLSNFITSCSCFKFCFAHIAICVGLKLFPTTFPKFVD